VWSGPRVILTLQVAVVGVSLILLAGLVALALGRYRLHGRLNLLFFVLTLAAVLGLEVLIRFIDPEVFHYIHSREELRQGLRTHLCFAVPALILMPLMLYTGLTHRRILHLTLASLFGIAWLGTVWTGLFYLPTQ
jgi:uncharacterized membrane protein YozB (DUF420 family)